MHCSVKPKLGECEKLPSFQKQTKKINMETTEDYYDRKMQERLSGCRGMFYYLVGLIVVGVMLAVIL